MNGTRSLYICRARPLLPDGSQFSFEHHADPAKMQSTTSEGTLCEICARIPFQQLRDGSYRGGTEVFYLLLGKLSDVRDREYCSFCRLICQGISPRAISDKTKIRFRHFPSHDLGFHSDQLAWGVSIRFLDSRKLRILDSNSIDISRIRQWISVCSKDHPECLIPQSTFDSGNEIPNFRAIDVSRRCIASTSSSVKYVALSYVWGQAGTYRLLKSTLGDLMKSESLNRVWSNIPQTIKDAISFHRREVPLGRYVVFDTGRR